jgi:hypothetical protein
MMASPFIAAMAFVGRCPICHEPWPCTVATTQVGITPELVIRNATRWAAEDGEG